MKLREFDFNSIKGDRWRLTNLCVMEDTSDMPFGKMSKRYEEGSIGLTLKALPPYWANREIKETRWFFETFVIELKGTGTGLVDKDGNEILIGDTIDSMEEA